MAKPKGPAIGIDLGTTYSCVGVLVDGKVAIIPNDLGEQTTPSYVAFDNGEIIVGSVAKNQHTIDPACRLYDVKRLIGRRFEDPEVQKDIKLWPFKVIKDGDRVKVEVGNKSYFPEEISARVLHSLKIQAENYLGLEVKDAVITVPAYFTDGQRQATIDAGKIAGLNVLKIINEPTAAAVTYCFNRPPKSPENMVVFDLGGGTFDITILTMHETNIRVRAVGGHTHLGGEDFDNALVDYCIQKFEKSSGEKIVAGDTAESRMKHGKFIRRLKNHCESQKKNLTFAKKTRVTLDAVQGSHDMNVEITQQLFHELNKEKFEECIRVLKKTLDDSGLQKEQIHQIILVGGSSRIPIIQEYVEKFFDGKRLNKSVKPDEAVAFGASIIAAQRINIREQSLIGDMGIGQICLDTTNTSAKPELASPSKVPSQPTRTTRGKTTMRGQKTINIVEIIPLPIGIKVESDDPTKDFAVVLQKKTEIPCTAEKVFGVPKSSVKKVQVNIFQGEDNLADNNELLGHFFLEGFPPNCPENEPVTVTMAVNDDGILHVTANCERLRINKKVQVQELKGRLLEEEIRHLQII